MHYEIIDISYATVTELYQLWDEKYEGVALNKLKGFQRPWIFKQIKKYFPNLKDKNILSVGEGLDKSAKMLSEQYFAIVCVLDKYENDEKLDLTRYRGGIVLKDLEKENPTIKYVNGIAGEPLYHQIGDGIFDCIYSNSVLEHIPRDKLMGVFLDIDRMLKVDGIQVHTIDIPVDRDEPLNIFINFLSDVIHPNQIHKLKEIDQNRIKIDPMTFYETCEIFKLYWFPNKNRKDVQFERWTSLNLVLKKAK